MNRLARWMIGLYPAAWRARYGDEFEALLADSGADARVLLDLVRGGIRMRFSTWSFGRLAGVLGVAGMLLALGVSALRTPMYVSKATMQITPARISEDMLNSNLSTALNERVMLMQVGVLSRTSLARIINDPRLLLYQSEQKDQPLEDVIETMKKNISVQIIALPGALAKRASAFDIAFAYPDRFKAQATVRMLMEEFDKQNLGGRENLDVLDSASLPLNPTGPTRIWIATWGFGGGCLLAGLIWFVRRWRTPRQPVSLLFADGGGIA